MVYVIRKIARAKWEKRNGLADGETPAEAAGDIRTTDNALSVWTCEAPHNADDANEVVLALATGVERIDKVEFAWVARSELEAAGLKLHASEGRTPVADLRGRHQDIVELDMVRLCVVARAIEQAIKNRQFRRLSAKEVTDLIRAAVDGGRVAVEELPVAIRSSLNR